MSINGFPAGAEPDKSPWTQPRFVGAAVIVVLVAVLGIVLVLSGSNDSTDTPAAAPPPAAKPQPSTPAGDGGSTCGLPGGNQSVPRAAPARTRWELVGKMIAPTAPKVYGPGSREGGYRTCFAHSPIGALYATVNFWAASTAKPSADVYRHLAASSAARSQAIAASRGRTEPRLQGVQVAGFAFSSYDRERAVIKLALRTDNGRLVQVQAAMHWQEGDWLFEVPLDQNPPSGELGNLDGFVAWTGS